jgi:hypothetical protein
VRNIGGWASLAKTDDSHWSHKMRDFREVYDETQVSTSLVRDFRGGLEKAGGQETV